MAGHLPELIDNHHHIHDYKHHYEEQPQLEHCQCDQKCEPKYNPEHTPLSTNAQKSKIRSRTYALTTVPEPKVKHYDEPKKSDEIKLESVECEGNPLDKFERTTSPKCYLPDANNSLPFHHHGECVGAMGPWATGRVEWSPLSGLTGTRPVVDRYSITRFSPDEWKLRNLNLVNKANDSLVKSVKIEENGKNVMSRSFAITDQTQSRNTARLTDRTCDVNICKNTLERAINAQADEIVAMEDQRNRLRRSMAMLRMPERIAKECLDRRCGRSDTELVRDAPEEELVKEIALIAEIRDILETTLKNIEAQQIENRSARERLEFDWSDKKDAYEMDALNSGLNNKSTTVLFKPGATRYMNEQSTENYWKHFTVENLEQCETTRQKSIFLRQTLDAILLNAARDLRTQADMVERALQDRITCTEEIRAKLENDLSDCLRRLAETEKLIDNLTVGMKSLDNSMKVVQTRLDNRNNYRFHVENCRDEAQIGLIGEVKAIQDSITAMMTSIREAEDAKQNLMQTRNELEREIMLKRRSIMIDRDRCLNLRSHFPSSTALSGHS